MLNVADGDALLAAIRQIRANVAQAMPNTRVARVLVQPMVTGVGEALVGYRVDPAAGPLVMVAAGGILTEIYRDRSLRLAPVDLATAQGDDRRGARLCGADGLSRPAEGRPRRARGCDRGDVGFAHEPAIAEAEINPLIVQASGVVAVDALVKLVSDVSWCTRNFAAETGFPSPLLGKVQR